MRAHRISALLVFALFTTPSAVLGQNANEASPAGIWWEISAGAGGMRLTCAICDPTRELGPAVSGAVGAYGSPRIRVGIEGGGWANEDGDVRESVYRAGLVAQVHPRVESGLHLIAGLGWSGYRAELFTYDAVRLTLGAGWDLPLTGSWVVGNRLLLDAASFASLKNDEGAVASPVGLSVMTFGLYIRRR